jgi:hypothetical protein
LEIYTLVPFVYLESPTPLFLCPTHCRRFAGHVPRTHRPHAALSCATCPPTPCPPPSRPRAGLLLPPHVTPPPPEPPRLPSACQLPLPCNHAFFWTPSTSLSSPRTRSCICTRPFCSLFSVPTTAPHRTSAAPSGRRRQPPTPLPIPDPVLLEHRHDPLVLPNNLPNLALVHRNDRTTTPVSSSFRCRSALPLSRRSTAS